MLEREKEVHVSYIIRLESENDLPLHPRCICLYGRDDSPGREWHEWVPREKGYGVGFILTWRASRDVPLSEADLVGYYLVYLEELKRARYIRLDFDRRKNKTGYRLRVVHRARQIFIEQSGSEFFGRGCLIGTLDY